MSKKELAQTVSGELTHNFEVTVPVEIRSELTYTVLASTREEAIAKATELAENDRTAEATSELMDNAELAVGYCGDPQVKEVAPPWVTEYSVADSLMSYFINGDDSGLTADEVTACDCLQPAGEGCWSYPTTSEAQEQGFGTCDVLGLGANLHALWWVDTALAKEYRTLPLRLLTIHNGQIVATPAGTCEVTPDGKISINRVTLHKSLGASAKWVTRRQELYGGYWVNDAGESLLINPPGYPETLEVS